MAFEFHTNKEKYFNWQYLNSKSAIIPFIEETFPIKSGTKVLEIGSAEAGVLKAFIEKGCICTGIELAEKRVDLAKQFMSKEMKAGKVQFISRNIYDIDVEKDLDYKYDLIILKDVIEHIHDQKKIIQRLQDFLNPKGKIFFGFPPWYMPYGGHQQVAKNKLLSKLPYFHLLPTSIYKTILKSFGETEVKVNNLLEIKETGISIETFEKYCKQCHFDVLKKTHFLINPIYEHKFGLKRRLQSPIISSIPFVRNFVTTTVFYLIQTKN